MRRKPGKVIPELAARGIVIDTHTRLDTQPGGVHSAASHARSLSRRGLSARNYELRACPTADVAAPTRLGTP